jgi:transcriptional regulator with XRE-family HTH domain
MSMKKTEISVNNLFSRNINILVNKNDGRYCFADMLGITYDSVRRWCNGEGIPTGKQLLNIREIYNISIDWLLAGENLEPVYLKVPEPARAAFMVAEDGKYGTSEDECPVNCEGNLREICRSVKYVVEDDGEFADALKANIKAFKKSVELDRRVKNLEQSISTGQGGGMPQVPAGSTAKKRKAG